MEHRKIRRRGVQVTYRQKKKLIEFVSKNPQLISCKVTPEFNYRDSQRLWQTLANECNAIPGSKKTWRQWRKVYVYLKNIILLINLDLFIDVFIYLCVVVWICLSCDFFLSLNEKSRLTCKQADSNKKYMSN